MAISRISQTGIATMVGLGLACGAVSHATPPLLTVAEVAGPDLQVYVKTGSITLTQASEDGTRTALRPLVSDTPGPVPSDLHEWTHLSSSACSSPPTFRWSRNDLPAVAKASGTWEEPIVEVSVDGTVVAMGRVGRPARICALLVQQVDAIPGEEVVVLWQTAPEASPTGPNTHGVSILRIPETAQ
jgi:hypothetical protein